MENLKIYYVHQDINDGYDTYDSMVIVAQDEDHARHLSYIQAFMLYEKNPHWIGESTYWVDPITGEEYVKAPSNWDRVFASPWHKEVEIELIGVALKKYKKGEVIIASFNAG